MLFETDQLRQKSYDLIICATPRLALSIQRQHAKNNQNNPSHTPNTQTLNNWLDAHIAKLILLGEIPVANAEATCLTSYQERLLWQQVITSHLKDNPFEDLFDSSGLADAAMEANNYAQIWQLNPHDSRHDSHRDSYTEETKQFLVWQKAFQKACVEKNVLEKVRFVAWQIRQIALHPILLPKKIAIAGYDRIDPQIQALLDCLSSHGAQVAKYSETLNQTNVPNNVLPNALQIPFNTCADECRAAVYWAKSQLDINPNAQLAIVVPELSALREQLIDLLDDTFHPNTLLASQTELARCYELSLGVALKTIPLITTTLNLLRLFQRTHRLSLADFSQVLLANFWSAEISEATQRATIDAQLKRNLPLTVTWSQLTKQIALSECPILLSHCRAALELIAQLPKTQLPSLWALTLKQLLATLAWPGERSLSSHEYQAHLAFLNCVASLGSLDSLLGKTNLSQIIQHLSQLCREQIFQPRTKNIPAISVLGLLEATATQLDGVWVMGMNDHTWPPAPRLNALLPAAMQRAAGTPNADHSIQTAFAQSVHARLLRSGKQVIFSWAEKENDKLLRVSPMITALPVVERLPLTKTFGELCLTETGFDPEILNDETAPAVGDNETVKGGTALFKAQAICPAWGYYQYRLGAKKLETPEDGLDASTRGSLVHLALQFFWQDKTSAALHASNNEAHLAQISAAVMLALETFNTEHHELLSPQMLLLEADRLKNLLSLWLALELTREAAFSVQHCELRETIDIEGIKVNLTIDRIDRLSDGTLIVMDYKTGSLPSLSDWAEARIKEPQLPIYAAISLQNEPLSAVTFAHVKLGHHAFLGIADNDNLLPSVLTIGNPKLKAFSQTAWDDLMLFWKTQITQIALEIKQGVASVVFENEDDLKYCEVFPLLRLPERALQFERFKAEQIG